MKNIRRLLTLILAIVLTVGMMPNSMYMVCYAQSTPHIENANVDTLSQRSINDIHFTKDAAGKLSDFAVAPIYDIHAGKLILPSIDGYKLTLFGSDRQEVVDLNGNVSQPLETLQVKLLYRISDEKDSSKIITTSKNAIVTIPGKRLAFSGNNARPMVLPALREWAGGEGDVAITASSRIVVGSTVFQSVANRFASDLQGMTGIKLHIISAQEDALQPGDIFFKQDDRVKALRNEGYQLEIGGNDTSKGYVSVRAWGKTGADYGAVSILQIMKENHNALPKGVARDYPEFEKRGLNLDVARKYYPMSYLQNLAKQMRWYKLNMLSLHLSDDDIWNSLNTTTGSGPNHTGPNGWFRLESDTFPNLTAKEHYTKAEFRQFQLDCADESITVIPELDTPGHALAYTNAWEGTARPDNAKYLDVKNPQVLKNTEALFKEYIDPDQGEPTFVGPYVNIGTDEYKGSASYHEAFRAYCDSLLKYINGTGKKAVFWGSLDANPGTTNVTNDALMFAWYAGYANPKKYLDQGYEIVSMGDGETYIVPGGGYYNNQFGQAEYLFNNWLPNQNRDWGNTPAPDGHPGVKGGQFAVWGDFVGNGISVNDVSYRIQYNLMAMAEKCWAGNDAKKITTYQAMKDTGEALGDAPNTDFLYHDKTYPENAVLQMDDTITNQAKQGVKLEGHQNVSEGIVGKHGKAIQLNGGNSYIETDTPSIGFDWTFAGWVNPSADNAKNAVLMNGTTGTLMLGKDGDANTIRYTVEQYTHTFKASIPNNTWTHIALSGDYQGVKLYINGKFIDELKDKPYPNYNCNSGNNSWDSGSYPNNGTCRTARYYETLMLPMTEIGDHKNAFKGGIDELNIYNKVLTDDDIRKLADVQGPKTYENVALHKKVISTNPVNDGNVAANVVDGKLEPRWEFALNNTGPYAVSIPLNKDEDVNHIIFKERLWGSETTRIKNLKIEAVTNGTVKKLWEGVPSGKITNENGLRYSFDDITFDTSKADSVRFTIEPKGTDIDSLVNIAEIEMYGSKEASAPISDPTLVPHKDMQASADSANANTGTEGPAFLAIDDNPNTWWHTDYSSAMTPLPHALTLDLGKEEYVDKFTYLPRPNAANGTITQYELQVSKDNKQFFPVAKGNWDQNDKLKTVNIDSVMARYVRLVAIQGVNGFASAAEVNVYRSLEQAPVQTFYLKQLLAKVQGEDLSKYTSISAANVKSAIDDATKVSEDASSNQNIIDKAYLTLTKVYDALEKKGDKTELQKLYDICISLDAKNYSATTFASLQESLTKVKQLLADEDATQKMIDNAYTALQLDYTSLGDYTSLAKAVEDAQVQLTYDYTNITDAKAILTQAKALLNNADATLFALTVMQGNLSKAMHDLVPDKTPLQNLVNDQKDLKQDDYTIDSWTNYETALEKANDVLKTDAEAKVLTETRNALTTAYKNLKNVSSLQTDALKDILQKDDKSALHKDEYTQESWNAFEKAFDQALDIYQNATKHTQSEIDNAVDNLDKAFKGLVKYKTVDDAKALLATLSDFKETDYTPLSWKHFADAKAALQKAIADSTTLNKEIDTLYNTLVNAKEHLIKVDAPIVDTSALKQILADNDKDKQKKENYTQDSWIAFEKAYDDASTIYQNAQQHTQADVDGAVNMLDKAFKALDTRGNVEAALNMLNAVNNLQAEDYTQSSWEDFVKAKAALQAAVDDNRNINVKKMNELQDAFMGAKNKLVKKPVVVKADKKALQNIYDKYHNVTNDGYAAVDWQNFVGALQYASDILENPNALQMQVDQAVQSLQQAVKALQKPQQPQKVMETSDVSKTQHMNGTVQTGDTTAVNMLIGLLVIAAVAMVAFAVYKVRTKKEEKQ